MKTTKYFILSIITLLTVTLISCDKDDEGDTSKTATLKVNTTVEGYGAIAGVQVWVEDGQENTIQEKFTNSSGQVEFAGILAGTYRVWCYHEMQGNPNVIEYRGESDGFQLLEGQTKTITITLE